MSPQPKTVSCPDRPAYLSLAQAAQLIAIGIFLWAVAAALLRWLGPMGAYEGPTQVLTYALLIPGTVPFVLAVKRLCRLAPGQLFPGYALATTAAMLCDGVALAWLPLLYGSGDAHTAAAGAAILWGVGVGQALAYVFDR